MIAAIAFIEAFYECSEEREREEKRRDRLKNKNHPFEFGKATVGQL